MAGKPLEFTAEQRRMVEQMTAVGCTLDEVRLCIPWPKGKAPDQKTMNKHFEAELQRGHALAGMRVKKRLFDLIDEGSLGAICFYLKCRAGWSEVMKIEATGKDGAPLAAAGVTVYLPQKDKYPEALPAVGIIERITHPAPEPAPEPAPLPSPPRAPEPPPKKAYGSAKPVGSMWPRAADRF